MSTDVQRALADRLNNLCTYLNDQYYINSGGCCYVAYLIAKLLEHDGFEYKVIVWNTEPICEKHFSDFTCNHFHYSLKLGKYYINNMKNSGRLYRRTFSKVTSEELLDHYDWYSWNDTYDTSENYFISKILKTFYEDFTKDLCEE